VTCKGQLDSFLKWMMGTGSQSETRAANDRAFRRDTAWCWNIRPAIAVTGEVFEEVQLDGIVVGTWSCLIMLGPRGPLGWQWCDREKRIAWEALLSRFPAPRAAVCDGQNGLLAAIKTRWPATKTQRCLVHVRRNIRSYLTEAPKTDAGKALSELSRQLTRITTIEQASHWAVALDSWHQLFGDLTTQRTYRARTDGPAPPWAKSDQTWWYTHQRLRRAYRLLARLLRDGALFTHLLPELAGLNISATSNRIEGGVNAQLRRILSDHRGMTEEHQRRAIEWWLYLHSDRPDPPASLIRPSHHNPNPTRPQSSDDEPLGPPRYGTGLSAEEGLHPRKGWAGRS
jgi:hypothetical protein